jgi:hypothetical protein
VTRGKDRKYLSSADTCLLGNDAGKATEEMPSAVDDNWAVEHGALARKTCGEGARVEKEKGQTTWSVKLILSSYADLEHSTCTTATSTVGCMRPRETKLSYGLWYTPQAVKLPK